VTTATRCCAMLPSSADALQKVYYIMCMPPFTEMLAPVM